MTANQYNSSTTAISGVINSGLPDGQSQVNPTLVTAAATLALTLADHSQRTILQNSVTGCAMTLPAATGSGALFKIVVGKTITSVGLTVKAANASDAFIGNQFVISDGAAAVLGYIASANTDDTVTFNGTTTGGYAGDQIVIQDVNVNQWQVLVHNKGTGTEATCFSATVS